MVFYHYLFLLCLLFHHHLPLYQIDEPCLTLDIVFFAMSVCFFKSRPNGEYSSLLIVAAFFGKIASPVKNLYLSIFPDDKAEILDCIELCFTDFVINCFDFLSNSHFIIASS